MLKKWIPLWVIPLVVLFSIGTVWLRLSVVRTTYDIHQANHEMDEMRKVLENVQLKLAALRSPQHLEILSRTRFKLVQPRAEQRVQLKMPQSLKEGGKF